MTTTIGQLVAELFDTFEHRFHDEKLAAFATEETVDTLRRAARRHRLRSAALRA
jgi:hypothetical protein